MNREFVKKELEKRIAGMTSQILDLEMKDGSSISIEPWGTEQYIVYFAKLDGDNFTVKNIDELVTVLMEHPKKQNEMKERRTNWVSENLVKIREFFTEYIKDKDYSSDTWEFYSDWHKDVFGYRPHGIVCGEYRNPNAPDFVFY